jgi:hypothetical protein
MDSNAESIAARIAWENARHDAYEDHVVQKREFINPVLGPQLEINDREEFATHICSVLESKETQCFTAFSTGPIWLQADFYYHPPTNTAVIVPADARQSATAFRPEAGYEWFESKLTTARQVEPSIEIKQGGIAALYPETAKNREVPSNMSILSDALEFVDETVKATGEIAAGVAAEVKGLADEYTKANPNSGAAPEELQNAAYFAKAVDNPERFPPLSDEMKSQVEDRQASEEIARNLRESSGKSPDLSPEEQQAQMQDRMQEQFDRQKQHSM